MKVDRIMIEGKGEDVGNAIDAICAFLEMEDGCVRWFDGGEEVCCYTK